MTTNIKDNPRVSLIVLSYNQEKYISEALDGAFSQDYDNLEIVVSDDCSTDSTWSIITEKVKNYNGKHKIIINKNEVNIGLVRHVNKVLSDFFNGDFIAWAAGDDISIPNRITKCIEFFNKNEDVVALSTNLIVIDSDSNLHSNQKVDLKNDVIYDINYYLSDEYKHINGPSRMMKKEMILAFPPLNENCPTEDTTMLLRAFLYGKVAILKDKFVNYRVHSTNLSSAEGLKKMKVIEIINQYNSDLDFAYSKNIISKSIYFRSKLKIKQINFQRNNGGFFKRFTLKLESIFINLIFSSTNKANKNI
ncbi:MAG: glycosyltransferase [Flavobacteriales bacterium]|nr:glycosyltransferase [Flavobacteriales bacterium]